MWNLGVQYITEKYGKAGDLRLNQNSLCGTIKDQTERALWEVKNVIDCIPNDEWDACYCGMPLFKHVYHMLHSLDRWMINPSDRSYTEPPFHVEGLNDLDAVTDTSLSRGQMNGYFSAIAARITSYVSSLTDDVLLQKPDGCAYTRFTLILAQFRHLHTHMGMLMGFTVAITGRWPRVVGLVGEIPKREYDPFL